MSDHTWPDGSPCCAAGDELEIPGEDYCLCCQEPGPEHCDRDGECCDCNDPGCSDCNGGDEATPAADAEAAL